MKSVYLVKERTILRDNKGSYCGIAYYSTYKKALKDFNERIEDKSKFNKKVNNLNLTESYLKTHITEIEIYEDYILEIVLEQHEVY